MVREQQAQMAPSLPSPGYLLILVSFLLSAFAQIGFAMPAPAPAAAAAVTEGDDLFLLTTSISPNVVMLLDNSDSMMQIEWHPAYDPTAVPTCAFWDNDLTYNADDYGNTENECGNTRIIFKPVNDTLYDGRYLNWYFSNAADPYYNDIRNATATSAGCRQAGGANQFNDLYRRTRFEAAQHVLLDLLCIAEPKGIRFALAEFREDDDALNEDANGAYIAVDIARASPSHAANLEAHTKNVDPGSNSPLGEGLFQLYTYFMSRTTADIPLGQDGITRFPEYQYDDNGEFQTNGIADPVQYACQKSFVLIVTDGEPTRDDFDADPADTALGFTNFTNLIGDYNVDGEVEVPGATNEVGWYLDDIAKYASEVDMRPDFADKQCLDIYTVGFSTYGATDTYLAKTADVGNGLFFKARDGEELGVALIAALNDIVEKAQSFTAASVPSARTADGGDFYQSFFFPSGRTAFWEGHIRSWRITGDGSIHDKNDNCALDDADAGECNSGGFLPEAEYYWDVSEEMPAPLSRNLFTSKVTAGTPVMVPFDDALGASDLNIAPFDVAPNPFPNSSLYATLASSVALNEEGLADEVIAYAQGCFFNTGVSGANVSATEACVQRPSTFGDIFHSDPLVVRHPSLLSNDATYVAFKNAYVNRDRIIYVGTNSGYVHGINAGSWVASPLPGAYDEGTGVEQFGFMPWSSRNTIKNLKIDPAAARTYHVDSSPQVNDVWMYTNATTATKVANGSEWRTVLIGGMRQGGRQYYALDVTNPNSITGPAGDLTYPGYLWEFPQENDPGGDLAYMGESWSNPVLAKIRVNVGTNTNLGQGFQRDVAIFASGYDSTGNPNDTANYDATATAGRAIFVVDIKTGEVIAEKKFDSTATDATADMLYAMPATPAVFDLDGDTYADVIYVSDIGGNVFKWVIKGVGEDRVNDGSGLKTQPNWPFKVFFSAPKVTVSAVDYYKSFYMRPAGTYLSGNIWLAFGSGERNNIATEAVVGDDSENNRFYTIKDIDPLERLGTPMGTLAETDLTDFTATQSAQGFSNSGFYFTVADGEKFVTNSEIFNYYVYTASFAPVDTGDPCTSRGRATLYVFDIRTGAGKFEDGSGSPTRSLDIGTGLPSDPKISVGPNGKENRIYIQKSGTELISETLNNIDMTPGGIYWKEVP
jgi:type IV pilus assembly protein PilY1